MRVSCKWSARLSNLVVGVGVGVVGVEGAWLLELEVMSEVEERRNSCGEVRK